jgi:uncharacterized membrane protein (DUF441 family)
VTAVHRPAPARRLVEATGLYHGWCIVLVALLAHCVDAAIAVPLAGSLRDRILSSEAVFSVLGAATLVSAVAAQGLTFLRFRE